MDPSIVTFLGILALIVSALLISMSKPVQCKIDAFLNQITAAKATQIALMAIILISIPFVTYFMFGLIKDAGSVPIWAGHIMAWYIIGILLNELFAFFFKTTQIAEDKAKKEKEKQEEIRRKTKLPNDGRRKYFSDSGEPQYRYSIGKNGEVEIFSRGIGRDDYKEPTVHPINGSELQILDKAAIERIGFQA